MSAYTNPVVSLTTQTSVGAGAAFDAGVIKDNFGYDITVNGTPTAGAAKAEGSIDGSTWYDLAGLVGTSPGRNVGLLTGKLARFTRLSVSTAYVGGSVSGSVFVGV